VAEHGGADALLQWRAARYARPVAATPRRVLEIVLFSRGTGHYALPLGASREVRPLRHVARVPGSSPVVAGVFQFRGELLSAHDLSGWVGPRAAGRAEWVVVVEHAGARLGLLADTLAGIERLDADAARPAALPVTLGERGVCFLGVLGEQRLLIDPERLFTTPAFFRAF
jgi:purine-binding chemotaxis protein CheW